jgi:hypothetical protein
VDGESARVRWLRSGRGPAHAERLEQFIGDDLVPGLAVQPGQQLAEQRVADVGVMEAPPGPPPGRLGGQRCGRQLGERTARRAFPPRACGFGPKPAGMREQLADGQVGGRGGIAQIAAEPVGEAEPARVAQPQHSDRHERLRDRPGAILHVRVGQPASGDPQAAAAGRPAQLAVADQPRGHRG